MHGERAERQPVMGVWGSASSGVQASGTQTLSEGQKQSPSQRVRGKAP